MSRILAGCAGAALLVALSLPGSAQADSRSAPGQKITKSGQIDEVSSRHRRWHRGAYYGRRYYGGPRYYSAGPYWGGYPYGGYPYYPYYYRPRPFVGFGVGPFGFGFW